MTSTDQHYGLPSNDGDLLSATHTWRAVLRQAAGHLSIIADQPGDRATSRRRGRRHPPRASLRLTDHHRRVAGPGLAAARRDHSRAALTDRMRHRHDEGSNDAFLA